MRHRDSLGFELPTEICDDGFMLPPALRLASFIEPCSFFVEDVLRHSRMP